MADRPIIMSGPMVRALLDGRKTMTRRVIKRLLRFGPITEFGRSTTPGYDWCFRDREMRRHDLTHDELLSYCPYGVPGDRLWLRETFVIENTQEYDEIVVEPQDGRPIRVIDERDWGRCRLIPHYRATEPEPHIVPADVEDSFDDRTRWSPSIFMKRWASRLTLQLTDVRAERVQDISADDIYAEGTPGAWDDHTPGGKHLCLVACRAAFIDLWNAINGQKSGCSWDDNPWVWALSFTVIKTNIDQIGERDV